MLGCSLCCQGTFEFFDPTGSMGGPAGPKRFLEYALGSSVASPRFDIYFLGKKSMARHTTVPNILSD
jgi:hypothetical protein